MANAGCVRKGAKAGGTLSNALGQIFGGFSHQGDIGLS